MTETIGFIIGKFNYWMYIALMMIGFYAMIAKKNLVKKIVGMNIFQTAIILFFVSTSSKRGATIPIIQKAHIEAEGLMNAAQYVNPLPHVLMLTAIVVMVSTFGVALALLVMIYREYKTFEEDEIFDTIEVLELKK